MRLLVDLFPCQTNNRFRGIGRYTLALTRQMAELRGSHEMFVLANSLYHESFEDLRQEFIRLLPPGAFKLYDQGVPANPENESDQNAALAETLVRLAYQSTGADVVLTPHVFEGWGAQGVVPYPQERPFGSQEAAILYDLIPYLFPKEYLDPHPAFKRNYLSRLESLKKYDLLLAISEATRYDAINHLGIHPDRIVNISGAASSSFKRLNLDLEAKQEILSRLGISRPFVLYLGGNNVRKNMDGALKAYSQLPREILAGHQLVLNDVGDVGVFRKKAHAFGLNNEDVVITGRITDEDLVKLYNLCKLFIFPSLYEGFGLPVLEAMACGAPVIAANNSSLPEVVGRDDALFDASNTDSITSAIARALTDENLRQSLSEYGQKRAEQFSWKNSGQLSWDAIEKMQAAKRQSQQKLFPVPSKENRLRIAFVSPIPPQRSGISDYSADLLSHLVNYFDIDLFIEPGLKVADPFLQERFGIFPWTQLLERRNSYSTVVYQVGNSPFHSHMYDLIKEFPGVVVLHDFYISNLVESMSTPSSTWKKSFEEELDYSHGLRALAEYQAQDILTTIRNWPINRRVIKYAGRLIVHSEFLKQLIEQYYARGSYPTPVVVPPLRNPVPNISLEEKNRIRKELGIDPNAFVYCSFGLLTPVKLIVEIIQSFADALPSLGEKARLVFIGDFGGTEYKQQILNLIDLLGLSNKVQVTGYVEKAIYDKYLAIADTAIQLRANTRGETSAAVLDTMAHGIPTILNAHGTFNDYSPEDTIRISDPVTLKELSHAMIQLKTDHAFRTEKSMRAKAYITECHSPEKAASAYARAIYAAVEEDHRKLFDPVFKVIAENKVDNQNVQTLIKSATANFQLRGPSRILVDVSYISEVDGRSGVQRVVKCLIKEFFSSSDQSLRLELVRVEGGRLIRAARFAEKLLDLPSGCIGEEFYLPEQPGDVLFMLDSSWHLISEFLPVFENIRNLGGKIASVIYDLIPLRFPTYSDIAMTQTFSNWFKTAVAESDELLCISRSVADDVIAYIEEEEIEPGHKLDITYFHLGADIPSSLNETVLRDEVRNALTKSNSPLFIMVGTVEPRKGHEFVLNAFEELWQKGIDCRLCIAGKIGWKVERTIRRIRSHPEFNKHLFFLENPTDAEIKFCYQSAYALIAASNTEGFGLPIVEAALHHVPVLASDIPVFREVGGEGAMYFSLASPSYLAKTVNQMSKFSEDERLAMAKKVNVLTWKDSADWVLKILNGEKVYYRLEKS